MTSDEGETDDEKKAANAVKARIRHEWRDDDEGLGEPLHQLCDLHDEQLEEPPADQHKRAVELLKKVRARAHLGAIAPGAGEASRAMIERRLQRWRHDATALQKLVCKRFNIARDEL